VVRTPSADAFRSRGRHIHTGHTCDPPHAAKRRCADTPIRRHVPLPPVAEKRSELLDKARARKLIRACDSRKV
jgi:hypothetical protein